jgi:beta-lactamase class A
MSGALIRELRADLDRAGLTGSFLAMDLVTGAELGIDADLRFPLASLIKVPLAARVLEGINRNEIDGSLTVTLDPAERTPGPTGTSLFRHPSHVAIDDLLVLALTVSDDTAADALFEFAPPADVNRLLRSLEITDITARHTIAELHRTLAAALPPEQRHLALSLAISAGTDGGGHLIPQLDNSAANVGTARGMTRLLAEIWTGDRLASNTRATLRDLMGRNLLRHRLAPEFSTDRSRWSSKTGTFLHLRHESGVVEHPDGTLIAVTALTASHVPAAQQPLAEQTIGAIARRLHDAVRSMDAPVR